MSSRLAGLLSQTSNTVTVLRLQILATNIYTIDAHNRIVGGIVMQAAGPIFFPYMDKRINQSLTKKETPKDSVPLICIHEH